MKNQPKLNFCWYSLCLAVFGIGILSSCAPSVTTLRGWSVVADAEKEVMTISHEDLGLLVKDVRLGFMYNKNFSRLSEWTVESEEEALIVFTKEPRETTWKFEVSDEELNISCSSANTSLKGFAPAPEDRIPARVEGQDNGIMHTSLGFVSSRNIYSLFDRETGFLIQFPKESSLSRNLSDEKLMEMILPVVEGAEISLVSDYYIKVLGLKYYQPIPKRFMTAPVGWCSWYCYYMGTTEEDMVIETDALVKYLKPYGLEIVQLDACFTRGEEANYLEWTKETFPQGGKWVFEYIMSKGLKPGLWVNAYGANYARPEGGEKYPENYYLRDKEGNLSSACCTADDTEVRLDYSNPEVIEKHLRPLFKILKDDWGLKYLKDAGWGTWMDYYDKNKENAFDPTKGSRELYFEVQKALRETLGPEIYITGCAMHEVGLCFGLFDGSRTGGDDKAVWYPDDKDRMSMQTFFHSLFGANYLHNITWFSDPDVVMVRNPLTLEEARPTWPAISWGSSPRRGWTFTAKLYLRLQSCRLIFIPTKLNQTKKMVLSGAVPRSRNFPEPSTLKSMLKLEFMMLWLCSTGPTMR
jgi:hypothetical protein